MLCYFNAQGLWNVGHEKTSVAMSMTHVDGGNKSDYFLSV